jgi:predicted  nucleic acid-binding Zn-ribbon protein
MTTTNQVTEPDDEGGGRATALERLLEVQRHDTRADQIRHRRANLPERTALAEREADREQAERELRTTTARRDELQAEQDRIEGEVAKAKERIAAADGKLYGGATSNPRELQALQDEVASLGRRVGLLEDSELEVMEQLEPVDAAVVTEQARLDSLGGEIESLRVQVTAAETELDVELGDVDAQRAEAVGAVPAELLDEYERIRARSGGIGVAPLTGGQCGGCHIKLSAVELDRIKKLPTDAVVHCDECGRLLVH